MNPNWREAHEKRITIPDHEPATFEGYINWVYSDRITLNNKTGLCENCADRGGIDGVDCLDARSLDLVLMFALGDYLNDVRFCNAIIDEFKSLALRSNCVPSLDATCSVWELTSLDCHLRDSFLQQWANTLNDERTGPWLKDQEIPRNVLVDLLIFVGKRHKKSQEKSLKQDREQWATNCSFHAHFDDSDKCS